MITILSFMIQENFIFGFLSDNLYYYVTVSNCFVFFFELQAEQGFYFTGKDSSDLLKKKFKELIGEHEASPQEVEVIMGRTLQVCFSECFGTECELQITLECI